MFYRFRENLNRKWFNYWCRDILSTKPIQVNKDNLLIVSMVSHMDLLMYLIAIKSFYRFLNRGEIVVIDDGTLSGQDRNLLKNHIPKINFVHIKDISKNCCPKGACWERLLFISDYVGDRYVIQLDSDSLILKDVPEY